MGIEGGGGSRVYLLDLEVIREARVCRQGVQPWTVLSRDLER